MYYRMLGAKIGKGVRISPQADIAEYDLVTIGDNVAIEYSTCRSFGVDNGAMVLGPVTVGENSSVGVRAVVAPYTSIPDNRHLGPASSSYDISSHSLTDDDDKHLRYNRQALPQPSPISQTFIVGPILLVVNSFSHIPALSILWWMLHQPWNYEYPFQNIGHMMQWFCEPRRIPFFIGIRIARAILCPFFYIFAAIIVKRCIIGKFEAGLRDTTSEWQLIRHNLAAQLFTREKIQQVTELLGRHYELVSSLYRLLGAKVGKRVFWPGRQPVFTGEFDLLEIGDDVVFGSRSTIFCTTKTSAEKIILCAGSNVSDNTVVLPGSTIGKGSVLGSNAVCPAGRYLPEGSLWFGVRNGEPVMLDKGVENTHGPVLSADIDTNRLEMKGDLTTLRPFGKAFYYDHANYFVYPLQMIIAFTVVTRVVVAALSSISIIGAVHLTAGHFYGWPIYERDYFYIHVSFGSLYFMMLFNFCITHFVHTAIWFIAEMVLKWGIIGQRQEGRYNYDASSYCQNWEVYQIATKVRELGRMNFLDFIRGTPHMVTYFRWLGCKIGEDCCLYPSGGDPYMPEPDLVEMGDRCIIDCASIVCHLNTSGNFELVKIIMENNVTLRTRARIQQGVYMESGSMLLEKCLAMTGEVIDADSVWLGAPATKVFSYDYNTVSTSMSKATSFSFPISNKSI
jgi:acetyltransferase-like isoleucine patch superfamily enzyme